MGEKSRGNHRSCQNITDKEFNEIFNREEIYEQEHQDEDIKSTQRGSKTNKRNDK